MDTIIDVMLRVVIGIFFIASMIAVPSSLARIFGVEKPYSWIDVLLILFIIIYTVFTALHFLFVLTLPFPIYMQHVGTL